MAEYLQTLLDTVPAGLLVLEVDDTLALVNRAAHRLLGESAPRLADLPSLGSAAAAQLAALAPGAHRIVQFANGRRLLASAAQFATPGAPARRLVSLQRLAGDLDAVELKAWDDMARVLAHEMMNSLTPIASLSQSLDALLRDGGRTEEVRDGTGDHLAAQPGPAAFRGTLSQGGRPARAAARDRIAARAAGWRGAH